MGQELGDGDELMGDAPAHIKISLSGPLPRTSMLWPRRVAEMIRESRPDILHTHSGTWFKASRAAQIARVPHVVYTDHGRPKPDTLSGRIFDWAGSRHSSSVVAVSDTVADQLRVFVRHPERIQVILNGVDCDSFRPGDASMRRQLGASETDLLIGSVGRLETIKGYDVMVQAFAELRSNWTGESRLRLILAGDGDQRSALEALARELGIESDVVFLGWRRDVVELLQGLDIFCLSSRSEGTSISLLEAMACGVSPVVTDVGGNAAVLGPALSQNLVGSEDPSMLAGRLQERLQDDELRASDSFVARSRVVSTFSLDAMVEQYQTLYEALWGEDPRSDKGWMT